MRQIPDILRAAEVARPQGVVGVRDANAAPRIRGGDLMPWMFRHRKLGLLVGKRTWGGLVHTADTPVLIDGGTMIAPRGGFFTRDGKWAVENEGAAPDIAVENWPTDVIAGHDPQLERAVAEALRQLKEKPVQRRSTEPPPPTWGQR